MEDIWNIFGTFKQKQQKCDLICCDSQELIISDGGYTCKKCHVVCERYIDSHAEWRYYGPDDSKHSDPNRCGMPTCDLLPDSSLGSMISSKLNESYEMKLVRMYHTWNSMSYRERSLYNIFDSITVQAVNSGINASIIEEAKVFYKKISDSNIYRGDNRSGVIATSIYMACKSNGVPRSTKEIAKMFNLKLPTITRGCKQFSNMMHTNIVSTGACDFISRYCSKLNLHPDMKKICVDIINRADELDIVCENTPPSVAAAVIYLCSEEYKLGLNKKTLSEICEISQVTITKCYKKLNEFKDMLFNKDEPAEEI